MGSEWNGVCFSCDHKCKSAFLPPNIVLKRSLYFLSLSLSLPLCFSLSPFVCLSLSLCLLFSVKSKKALSHSFSFLIYFLQSMACIDLMLVVRMVEHWDHFFMQQAWVNADSYSLSFHNVCYHTLCRYIRESYVLIVGAVLGGRSVTNSFNHFLAHLNVSQNNYKHLFCLLMPENYNNNRV